MTKAIKAKATRSVAVSRIISAPCIAVRCKTQYRTRNAPTMSLAWTDSVRLTHLSDISHELVWGRSWVPALLDA